MARDKVGGGGRKEAAKERERRATEASEKAERMKTGVKKQKSGCMATHAAGYYFSTNAQAAG